jgi:hypothetical protein
MRDDLHFQHRPFFCIDPSPQRSARSVIVFRAFDANGKWPSENPSPRDGEMIDKL